MSTEEQQLREAVELIDKMAQWMRLVLPGQEPGRDDQTRTRLLTAAYEWKAGLRI